ncbi:MAG: molybdopterin molybdotransferase MoeA, partial [Chthoniobacterales bacterium]
RRVHEPVETGRSNLEKNIAVERAEELILSSASALQTERVDLASALHRVLRETVCANEDSPRFDCSAVDGYALRRADADQSVKLVAEIQAGVAELPTIAAGECARIFTGAQLPAGADYVAMQEDVMVEGKTIRLTSISSGSNIRRRGENSHSGDMVVSVGSKLRAAEIAALASCGAVRPLVTRAARVVHFVTGNELIDPAETPTGTELRDSNSGLVSSFLLSRGADLIHHQRVGDSLEEAKRAVDSLNQKFDLLLVSGGASVGDYDFAVPMLEHGGFQMRFESVNLRPGKPLKFFTRDAAVAFALPGNPVSHWVILQFFISKLLRAWSGIDGQQTQLSARLEAPFAQTPNRRETQLPAIATATGEGWRLRPLPFTSSGDTASVVGANALLRIPAGSAGFSADDPVSFRLCEN